MRSVVCMDMVMGAEGDKKELFSLPNEEGLQKIGTADIGAIDEDVAVSGSLQMVGSNMLLYHYRSFIGPLVDVSGASMDLVPLSTSSKLDLGLGVVLEIPYNSGHLELGYGVNGSKATSPIEVISVTLEEGRKLDLGLKIVCVRSTGGVHESSCADSDSIVTLEDGWKSDLDMNIVSDRSAGSSHEISCSDPIENFSLGLLRKGAGVSKDDSRAVLLASYSADSETRVDSLSGKGFSPYLTVTRNSFLPQRKPTGSGKGKEVKVRRKGSGGGQSKNKLGADESDNSVDSVCGDIPDKDVVKGNSRSWAKEMEGVAFKLWEKVVAYGVEGDGLNNHMVEAILVMKERDRSAKALKGVNTNSAQ